MCVRLVYPQAAEVWWQGCVFPCVNRPMAVHRDVQEYACVSLGVVCGCPVNAHMKAYMCKCVQWGHWGPVSVYFCVCHVELGMRVPEYVHSVQKPRGGLFKCVCLCACMRACVQGGYSRDRDQVLAGV